MAVFTVTHRRRADNVCAVQTLTTPVDVEVGDTVVVASVHANFDGTYTVISREPYYFTGKDEFGYLTFDYSQSRENQILYAHNGDDLEYEASSGTVTITETCTWIIDADVIAWLGIDSATANDTAFITTCRQAANAWAFRKREQAGYTDVLATAPSADVKLGTIMYAATLYRERGSVDSFASFDSMVAGGVPSMSLGRIMQLLGINRSQVA